VLDFVYREKAHFTALVTAFTTAEFTFWTILSFFAWLEAHSGTHPFN
jgi:hypothetical protein